MEWCKRVHQPQHYTKSQKFHSVDQYETSYLYTTCSFSYLFDKRRLHGVEKIGH